jgi:hypothetical protein
MVRIDQGALFFGGNNYEQIGGDLVQGGEGRRSFIGLEEGDEFGGEADVLFQGTIAMPSETRRHLIQFVNRINNLYNSRWIRWRFPGI